MGNTSLDGSGATVTAAATSEAACRPSRPTRDDTIHGASIIVAAALLREQGTCEAAVLDMSDNTAAACLAAAAATETACRPL